MAEKTIEEKAAEMKAELDTMRAEYKKAIEDLAEATKKLGEAQTKGETTEGEIKKMQEDVVKLNEGINDLNKKMAETKMEKQETFVDALKAVYEGAEFKTQLEEVMSGKRAKSQVWNVEVKDDPSSVITSGATNPVARTYGGGISGALYEPNKFIAAMNVIPVPADKNRAMWFDGVYYDNAGYMTELTAITTGDGATIEEKYRELAKVGAKLPFSKEAATEMSYFVNWARTKGIESVLSKIDELIYAGVGADGGAYTKNIYGLKSQGATAFNATTADMATSVQDANLADLILAAANQVKIQGKGMYIPDMCFLYPSAVAKLRALKNKQADYINMLPDGSLLVHGIQIIESAKVGSTEMLLVTSKTLQLHQMGGLETEVERVASTDSYVMYLRWKGQVVVPTTDKLANIFVANTTTSIAAISAGAATSNVLLVNTIANPAIVYGITTTTTTTTTTTAG